ncbi:MULTISPECIES: GTP pyrophosphokinase [unclassified Microbacterium]|uniref:GTP pyrophosphokinase n=1 Tax=unclassified Microbacterium TaxID=2609290 RepID=UPI00300F8E22
MEDDEHGALVRDAYRRRPGDWTNAQSQVQGWLRRIFEDILEGDDGSRLDPDHARIKSEDRTLDKLSRKRAEDPTLAVRDGSDVEQHVQDIAGVKVLCKSPRDQRAAVAALRASDLSGTALEIIETKDYLSEPKASGYRAFHLLVRVTLPSSPPVCVEVQIKTRLQDAWSELTHEDLYKPGAPINPSGFHKSVASHMASLLAVVDEMADELAGALESTIAEDVSTSDSAAADAGTATIRTTGPRYALAIDESGRQGLISARAVRELAAAQGMVDDRRFIKVSDYLRVGDRIRVDVVETDDARHFLPLSLVGHADDEGRRT